MSAVMDPQIVEHIRNAQRILIITHISPDGDAVGSLLGLGWALRSLNKDVALVCGDPIPPAFAFLPGYHDIDRDASGPFDLVIGLDASDPQRLGTPWQRIAQQPMPKIVIDHHVTNLFFGDLNWVDTKAASTAEMIFDLVKALDVFLTPNIAQALLCGVVTDTRGFRTSNTTARTMAIATELMQHGADLNLITEQTLNRKPLAVLKLWARALPLMQIRNRIVWTTITHEMRQETGNTENGDGGLVNVLISANEADVAVVFTERNPGQIEIGFRAKPGFDVSQVALSLGGGGHPQAAGCTVMGTMDEVQRQVLAALEASLAQQAKR
ncbi:MAG: bifunctional oligoribonuclease/PAP phosphatase NrnA [Anaerolineae bacterium]